MTDEAGEHALCMWIGDATERAIASRPASTSAGERTLLEAARVRLLEAPHRYVHVVARPSDPLGPSAPERSIVLEGLLNLRLAITHAFLNPLEVGAADATRAAALVVALDAAERTYAIEITCEREKLRYETIRFLHPPPPFTGAPKEQTGPEALPALVARWETARAARPAFGPWLRAKLRQHAQFYRFGAGFPLYAARQRRILRRLPPSLRANPVVRETFSALEQLGPILDNFVFDQGLRASANDTVAVADFAFLYMQLADELVDNLVKLGGNEALRRLLLVHPAHPVRSTSSGGRPGFVPLENLDHDELAAVGIDPASPIAKYGIPVATLVDWLRDLRRALLALLDAMPSPALRDETSAFFAHCFATFLDELELPRLTGTTRLDLLPYAEVAWHFHRKNNEVMTRWLVIRARILGIEPARIADVIARWGVLLASFQIFDDLKDVAIDLGHQPSYAIEIARRFHPEEFAFLERDFGTREHSLDRNDVTTLNVAMAGTVRDCIRWSRLFALSSYDWFLDYVSDYRWRRNWLLRARSFHRAPRVDVPIERGPLAPLAASIDSGVPVVDAVFRYLAATHTRLDAGELSDSTLAFVLDVIGYDHDATIQRALFPDVGRMYRLANLRMRMTDAEKTSVLARVVHAHPLASRLAIGQLRDARGSDLAWKVARAFDLDVPARGLDARRRAELTPSGSP